MALKANHHLAFETFVPWTHALSRKDNHIKSESYQHNAAQPDSDALGAQKLKHSLAQCDLGHFEQVLEQFIQLRLATLQKQRVLSNCYNDCIDFLASPRTKRPRRYFLDGSVISASSRANSAFSAFSSAWN